MLLGGDNADFRLAVGFWGVALGVAPNFTCKGCRKARGRWHRSRWGHQQGQAAVRLLHCVRGVQDPDGGRAGLQRICSVVDVAILFSQKEVEAGGASAFMPLEDHRVQGCGLALFGLGGGTRAM